MSLNTSLNIGARSMFAQQGGLATAGHNISNINTPGYSRQESLTKAQFTQPDGTGGGVSRSVPQRVFDQFTSKKIVQENPNSGMYEQREMFLQKLEVIFNETDSTGLKTRLDQFWNAWTFLSNEPESDAARKQMRDQADALAQTFRETSSELHSLRAEANGRVAGLIAEINSISSQIADLNRQISSFENQHRTSNDARDQRQGLLEDLASKVDVQWWEDKNGEMKVAMGRTGWTLVDGRKSQPLHASLNGNETGMYFVQGVGKYQYREDLTDEIRAGALKEAISIRDEVIPQYTTQLNDIAYNLAYQINTEHATGTGLNSSFETIKSDFGLNAEAQTKPLPFLKDGEFNVQVLDEENNIQETYQIRVNAGADRLVDIVSRLNEAANPPRPENEEYGAKPPSIVASIQDDGSLVLEAKQGKRFILGEDSSGLLAMMGLNSFFKTLKGASDISVSQQILDDPNYISTGRNLEPGDNRVALNIAKLQIAPTMQENTMTFDEYYNGILTDVGLRIQRNDTEKNHQDHLMAQFKDIRNAMSAVNMDEEVADLVRYQKAYEASAKFVTTTDQMMETVIQM